MRKIAIVGTRPPCGDPPLPAQVAIYEAILRDVRRFCDAIDHAIDPVLVSGGADGVDREAEEHFGHMIIHRPDYATHGHLAPLMRNTLIVRDADEVHAWPSPWSKGTWDTVRKARAAGKPVTVHEVSW